MILGRSPTCSLTSQQSMGQSRVNNLAEPSLLLLIREDLMFLSRGPTLSLISTPFWRL